MVHGGHHGGAWKVAYADFVTAMMALFIVLWLMGASEPVKKAVAATSSDPSGKRPKRDLDTEAWARTSPSNKDDMGKLKEKLESAMLQSPDLATS